MLFQTKTSFVVPYVPYEFVVVAATTIGKGEIAPFKFFTDQDGNVLLYSTKQVYVLCLNTVPKVSPTIVSSIRTSADEILLKWVSLNDDDLQGFLDQYILKYYTSIVYNDCSSPMNEKVETTTDEYLLLKKLDPHSAYCVKVAAATSVGAGKCTDLIYIESM